MITDNNSNNPNLLPESLVGSLVSVSPPVGRALWELSENYNIPVSDRIANDAWYASVGTKKQDRTPAEGVFLSSHEVLSRTSGIVVVILSPDQGPMIIKFDNADQLSQHLTPIPSDR